MLSDYIIKDKMRLVWRTANSRTFLCCFSSPIPIFLPS